MNDTFKPPAFFIVFVAALVAIGPFSIDTYLPALPAMAIALQTDIVQVNNTLSIYLFGYAIGQLIGGPLSDQVGRKVIGLLGLVIFTASSILIAAATSITEVLALRGIQALGGGFSTVICMAMVRDAYPPQEAMKQFPKVMMVMLAAPLLAPGIGAALLSLGWASIFFFLAIYGVVMSIWLVRMPETAHQRSGTLAFGAILPQYIDVLTFRVQDKFIPLRYIFSQGLMGSILLVFITNSSFIYLEYYDVGADAFVFYFAANVIGMMIGNLITARLIHKISAFSLYRVARGVQFTAVVCMTFVVNFTDAPLLLFTPLLAIAVGSSGVISPSVQGLYLANFGKLSGSATSLMNTSMFLFGSLMGLISGLFFDGSLAPMVYTMLLGLTLGNLIAFSIPAPSSD